MHDPSMPKDDTDRAKVIEDVLRQYLRVPWAGQVTLHLLRALRDAERINPKVET